ncbi:MAG TPA: hypothetical protein VFJ45_04480 [bacterium]|nr:hypothetical protein [bacterium]
MARHGVLVIGLVVLLVLGPGGTSGAYAQITGEGKYHRLALQYWPASGSGPTTSWTTGFFGLHYSGSALATPFGLRAQYLSGSTSLGQAESFWEIDLTYRLAFKFDRPDMRTAPLGGGPVLIRSTVGYASFSWNAVGGPATSRGFGIGSEATMVVRTLASGGTLALVGDFVWFPSTSTTGPLGSGTGSMLTWSVGLRYKSPAKKAGPTSDSVYVSTLKTAELLGKEWDLTVGGMGKKAGSTSASDYSWSGFYVAVGKTF